MPLQFRREDRDRVARGEITVTYRLWQRAHVKAGKAYATGFGEAYVDDVRLLPAALVDEADAALAGCESIEAVWRSAGEHTKTAVGPDTLIYRVQFHMTSSGI